MPTEHFLGMFLSNFLKVCILLLFFFFPFWKILGNKETWKKSPKNFPSPQPQTKKTWEFSVAARKKITPDTHHAVDLSIGVRFCWRMWTSFFSRNENIRKRTTITFPGKRGYKSENINFFPRMATRIKKSYSRWTIIRHVSLVPKSDENLWQLLVDRTQVFHAALRQFY